MPVMSAKENKAVTTWLFVVAVLIMFMVVLGGYVRLSRSGLSMVEWEPVLGVIPPIGEEQWQAEFAKYQATPEYIHINRTMTLPEYQKIFYVEYVHRLLARFAGLVVLLPLAYFILKGIIPWRQSGVYVAIVILFGLQGALGWYMVSSGLQDVPAVSPFRLTIHLLMALFLLTLTLWLAWNHLYGFPQRVPGAFRSVTGIANLFVLGVLVLQISYGGLMAGLKAGHVTNSWPLMYGRLIPQNLFKQDPWWINLLTSTVTVHFIHRWLAFGVLIAVLVMLYVTRKRAYSSSVHNALWVLLGLTGVQILLGISVIWFNVPLVLALLHQATALLLFVTALFLTYRVAHEPVPYPGALQPQMELTPA